jgi:hypothetical protein
MEFENTDDDIVYIRLYRDGKETGKLDYLFIDNYQSIHIRKMASDQYEIGIVINSSVSYGIQSSVPKKLIKKYMRSSKLVEILK